MIKMNIDKCIEILSKGIVVNENTAKMICLKAIEILAAESQVLRIQPPVTVCGDIHGQFYDLKELFKLGGELPSVKYLFLGDYVHRGYYSTETFLLLLALKIKYPEQLFLLRGNHEIAQMTMQYGFYEECCRKYAGSSIVCEHCSKVFDFFSLTALIGDRIFCVHGGLSPSICKIDSINGIKKHEIKANSPASDLVWSDPSECNGWITSPRVQENTFSTNILNINRNQ